MLHNNKTQNVFQFRTHPLLKKSVWHHKKRAHSNVCRRTAKPQKGNGDVAAGWLIWCLTEQRRGHCRTELRMHFGKFQEAHTRNRQPLISSSHLSTEEFAIGMNYLVLQPLLGIKLIKVQPDMAIIYSLNLHKSQRWPQPIRTTV